MKPVRVYDVVRLPREVIAIDAAATLAAAVSQMRAHGIHHLVVLARGRAAGVLSYRDVLDRGLRPQDFALDQTLKVADLMQACTAAVAGETTIRSALETMTRAGASALPVMVDGTLVGILTETDLLRVLGRLIEKEEAGSLETASRQGRLVLSNPVLQNALQLLAEAGI